MSNSVGTIGPVVTDRLISQNPGRKIAAGQSTSRPIGRGRLTAWDAAGMLAGFLLTLVTTYVLTHGRIFWEDELLGWMLLRDPSWHHMVQAWKMGADGGGFSFYLIGRGWFHVFGSSEMSFRMFSSTCFGLAFAATWAAARRHYGTWAVAFALFNTWFFSPPFVYHMAEGRFYGLLILSTALAFWLALALADAPQDPPVYCYILMFLVHGLLTTSHLLGVIFSAFLVTSILLLDRLEGRWRPLLYLSGAVSWLLLVPERAAIIASAQVGKPHFYTTRPTIRTFLGVYSGFSPEMAAVLILLGAAAAFSMWRRPTGGWPELQRSYQAKKPVYITTLALLLVPFAFVVQGAMGTWLFTNRYLLPVTIALGFVTAEALSLAARQRVSPRVSSPGLTPLRIAAATMFSAALLYWVFVRQENAAPGPIDYTPRLATLLPRDLPVVVEDGFSFPELANPLHAQGVNYIYLLDWNQTISDAAPRVEVTQYHIMENLRRAGYLPDSVKDIEPFLAANRRFLVVHAGPIPFPIGNPLADRFAHNPEYQVQKYVDLDRGGFHDTVWLVCRNTCWDASAPSEHKAHS